MRLRPADLDDAMRTIAVRNTPGFEVGLPRIPDDVDQQKTWLALPRQTPDAHYFFVETRVTGAVEGLIGRTAAPTATGKTTGTVNPAKVSLKPATAAPGSGRGGASTIPKTATTTHATVERVA